MTTLEKGLSAFAVILIAFLVIATQPTASEKNADRLVEEYKVLKRYCTELFKQDAAAIDRCVTYTR